jgi:FKBP-type peptidyl-prolyl cis-trans isomerase
MTKMLALLALGCATLLAGCGDPVVETLKKDQLYIDDKLVGNGEPVVAGDFVRVKFTAWIYERGRKGAEVERSGDQPRVFQVGKGAVIAGFDRGLLGMRPGGQRTLVVGPTLAYGESGTPDVPANSNLLYELELVAVPRTEVRELAAGAGPEVQVGDFACVDYVCWIYENGHKGRQLDSSAERGEPLSFKLGAGMVISGWEQGIRGMRAGGRRELVIPPEFGFGERGTELIPPGATLLYDVTLVTIPRVAIRTLRPGTGEGARPGDILGLHYTGWIQVPGGGKGGQFQTSRNGIVPFQVKLGEKVIPGWNQGLEGMKVGEVRELVVPPELAYGKSGISRPRPLIPPDATLIFEIELLSNGVPPAKTE